MRINFRKIEIHNFMSFGDDVFEFENFKGMTRIKGQNFDLNQKNGCGKSTISNALVYGLYGQLPFKLSIENIYNRYLDDHNVTVTVYFDSNRRKYKVISGIKRMKSFCELYDITGKTEENLTKSSIQETRYYIERELLHCDINLFMRTIVLNSDPNFNFYNLNKTAKKDFIDKLFDIYIYGSMYDEFHREKLATDKDIIANQNQLIVLNRSTDEYKTMIDSFNKTHEEKIATLKSRIANGEKELEKKRSSMVKKNTSAISSCENSIKEISDKIEKINTLNQNYDLKINKIKYEIKTNTTAINDRKKFIDKHSVLKSKLCDKCKDIFSDYYSLKKYQDEMDKLVTKNNSLTEEINKITSDQTVMKTKKTEHLKKQEELSKELSKLNFEYENAQNELRKYENALNTLKYQLDNEINQENPYIGMLENNNKKIDEINDKMSKIMDRYKYVKFAEGILEHDNLKKFIIKDLIGLLNNKIKYYLHKLGANYDIVFDEEMDYDFITDVKDNIEFNNFSKGEQARISVATCFAFRDFLSSRSNIMSNIFILDEFFDSNVDPMAIEATVEILKEFVKINKQQTFVISHRSEVSDDIFDNIISVEKKNHVSKIRVIV